MPRRGTREEDDWWFFHDYCEDFLKDALWNIVIIHRREVAAEFRCLARLNREGCKKRGIPVRTKVPALPVGQRVMASLRIRW